MLQNARIQFIDLLSSLFQFENQKGKKLLNQLLLVVAFFVGLLLWVRFLNYGNIPSDRLDWLEVTFPRLDILQKSFSQTQFPLHVSDPQGIKGVTDRFLAIPDLIFSPDVLLLSFVSITNFLLSHILICYSIGFLGLLKIKRRFHLSFTAFFILFLLFNFNGFITSHIAIGHLTWGAYFLLPFFIDLTFDIYKQTKLDWMWVKKFVALQFAVYLFGGYHFFVWILLFIFIVMLCSPGKRKSLFLAMLFSALVNSYRIIPSALLFGKLPLDFHTSFPFSYRILTSLIAPPPLQNAVISFDLLDFTIFETDFYIGLAAFIFLLIMAGLFFRNPANKNYFRMIIPIVFMAFMSMGYFFRPFFESGLPLLSGERVFTRFLALPLVFIFMIAVKQYQATLENNLEKPLNLMFFWMLNLLVTNDLNQHLSLWSIDQIITILPPEFVPASLVIQNRADPIYIILIIAGLLCTLAAFLFLFLYKEKSQATQQPE